MKVKKGTEWLKRELRAKFAEYLENNIVVDLDTFPTFFGRQRFIENMISSGELEKATSADIRFQQIIEDDREKQLQIKNQLSEQVEKEEAKLVKAIESRSHGTADMVDKAKADKIAKKQAFEKAEKTYKEK